MKYLCIIFDQGDVYKLTGFDEKEDHVFFEKRKYLEVDKDSYETIKKLSISNTLYYPKDCEEFKLEKVIAQKEDPLQLYKYSAKMKVESSFKRKFKELDKYLFLKYFCLSMELSDKGFFMHLNNAEETIATIKEKETILLSKAEELHSVIKEIETKMSSYDEFQKTSKSINAASSSEDVDDLTEKFINL